MADTTLKVYNHDIAGLYARIQRFMMEVTHSSSSGVSLMNAYDQNRLKTYLDAIVTYQNWVDASPQLDLPETNNTLWDIASPMSIADLENESLVDVLRLMHLCCSELINSQSARLPSGLVKFDSIRLAAYIDKAHKFLANYIAVADPLDLPESSPSSLMTGPGKTGV